MPPAAYFSAPTVQNASGGLFFLHQPCGMPPAAHSFLSCQKRTGRKEAPENGIALSRLKNQFVILCVLSFRFHSPNALRAAVQSGFPSARCAVLVALFAPVEYLTYGSRKAVLPARAALRIAHKRTAVQVAAEITAEYFDYLAGLSKTHL